MTAEAGDDRPADLPGEDPPAVAVEHDGAVALARLNRPRQRNALSNDVLELLAGELRNLDRDPAVRCIVVAGSDKVFASGADVRALAGQDAAGLYFGRRFELWDELRRLRTPTVAAVSGYCLGGGCELALLCDVVVASETARFGLPETGLGLIPGAGGTQRLTRAIGKAKAMDVVLSGRLLSATEAEQAGLVARVAPAGEWLATAHELARAVAARAPVAQLLAREAVGRAFETSLEAGLDVERRAFAQAFATDDAREGIAAFLAKRDPVWQGR
ncbi:MAG TPA: enoyl-CoA hydratase-related protein [Thermoleophilaceae bacterium]|nr:enoyl-CoA hydratase-related protein [Thermoleophilaceae bacterium]